MNAKDIPRFIFRKLVSFVKKDQSFLTPDKVERAEYIFYVDYLRKGMIVFDVGANIGEQSMLFSKFVGASGIVHAFEACNETFKQLSGIIELTGKKNIILNELALLGHNGIVNLHIYGREYSGWNTIADRPLKKYGIDIIPIAEQSVKSMTIDKYCETNKIGQIDLLKIDVEGAEHQVLQGAHKMLVKKLIKCVVFEFGQTTFDMGNKPSDIISYLDGCSYEVKNIIKESVVFPGGEDVSKAMFSMHIATPQ